MEATKFACLALLLLACPLANLLSAAQSAPECPEPDSYIPHEDCRFYYQCSNGFPILQNCSRGLYFNPRINICDTPLNVPECIGGTRPPPGTTTVSTTTEPVTETPESSTTTEAPVITTQPPTDPPTTTQSPTEPPTEPSTTQSPTEPPTEPSTTQSPTEPPTPSPTTEPPLCPPTGAHSFPYPGNCTLYIRCFNGVPTTQSCNPPLIFDKIDLICKPEAEAVCDAEGPVRCPPTGYVAFPHKFSCSKYYECFNGDWFEDTCAANTYFDATPSILQCNQAELALCNSECPPRGIEYLPIRKRGCKWYKRCVDGASTNFECEGNQVYDPALGQCVSIDAFTCPYT